MKPIKWTDAEIAWVKSKEGQDYTEDLADEFLSLFGWKATRHNIRRCREKYSRIRSFNYNNKSKETAFKKGHIPANSRDIGGIMRKGKWLMIKVQRNPSKYEAYHMWLWKKERGPIPEGMVVSFKDGDSHNCTIDNLILLSRSALVKYCTTYGREGEEIPAPVETTLKIICELELAVEKRREKRKYTKRKTNGRGYDNDKDSPRSLQENPG